MRYHIRFFVQEGRTWDFAVYMVASETTRGCLSSWELPVWAGTWTGNENTRTHTHAHE